MTNKEKGLAYIKQLRLPRTVAKHLRKGRVMRSTMATGILMEINSFQKQRIKQIEAEYSQFGAFVWHVVDDPDYSDQSELLVDIYLLALNESPEKLTVCEGKTYYAEVYADNLSFPVFSEYGEVLIAKGNGGIVRKS